MVKKCSFPILLTSLFILIIVASSGFSQTSFFKEIGYYPNGWGSYIRKAPEYNSWNQGIRYIIYVDGLGISNYHKGLNFSGNGTLFTNYLPYSYETLYQIEFSELGYDFYSGRSDYYGDIHSGTLVKPSKEIAKVFDSTLFRGLNFWKIVLQYIW